MTTFNLVSDNSSYLHILQNFQKNSTGHQEFTNFLAKYYNNKKLINVLSIGCGDASQDVSIMNVLDISTYTLLEPCKEFNDQIKCNLNTIINTQTNLLNISLEDFCDTHINKYNTNHFDLVIMAHVLYFIKDYNKYINILKIYANTIIIYLPSDTSIFYELRKQFTKLNNSSNDVMNVLQVSNHFALKCTLKLDCLDDNIIKLITGSKMLSNNEISEIKNKLYEYAKSMKSGDKIIYCNEIFII